MKCLKNWDIDLGQNKQVVLYINRKQRFFDSDIKIRLKLEERDLKKLLKIKK